MKKINSRNKGIAYEQRTRRELINMGFLNCHTSRYASKLTDDKKVDFVGTEPFNIQCKAVERGMNYHNTLNVMPTDENYNIIFHKQNRKMEIVVMSKPDFYELIKKLKETKTI